MYLSYTEILIMKIISPKFYRTFANPPCAYYEKFVDNTNYSNGFRNDLPNV